MSDQLKRARLIPYDLMREVLETDKAITFDFNPETLNLQVSKGQEMDASRRGRQQTQSVGDSNKTLSFEAIFDTTRPKGVAGEDQDGAKAPEKFDVRLKTSRIADLLQVEEKGKKPATRRVLFSWGAFNFPGLITSFSETLDYFSPEGVPLRSKVSIGMTEKHFRYKVSAAEARAAQKAPPKLNDAGAVATANDSDSLFDVLAGSGFNFDASVDLDLDLGLALDAQLSLGIDASLGIDLGLDIDLAAAAGAGIELSASAAVDVFGDAVLEAGFGADVDLGRAASGTLGAPSRGGPAGAPSNPWASEGPTPGTAAAELAASVNSRRASPAAERPLPPAGGDFSATEFAAPPDGGQVASVAPSLVDGGGRAGQVETSDAPVGVDVRPPSTPIPVRGSPPLTRPRYGPPPPDRVYSRKPRSRPGAAASGEHRPAWERLPDEPRLMAADTARRARRSRCGGCG